MGRINIYLNDKDLKLVDNQAKKADRTRSGQIAELIKKEDKKGMKK